MILHYELYKTMNPEDKILFACTRQNFQVDHHQDVLDLAHDYPIKWDTVYNTALNHGVAPLVYSNLQKFAASDLHIPAAIQQKFQLCFFRNMKLKVSGAKNLSLALAFLRDQGFEVMLIKGAALDIVVYEHPYYTTPMDIDIVLSVRSEMLTDAQNKCVEDRMHGLGIEYDYFEHHDVVMNGVLPVDFQRIWDEATPLDFRGHLVWVMTPEDMLLTACINSCRKRFFKLKSLADIAEIINRFDNLDWEKFVDCSQAQACHNVVYTALYVTKLTLGCNLPEGVLIGLKVNPAKAAVIRAVARYQIRRLPLSVLYPFSGKTLFGREVNLSLLLPYATYQWDQVGRKMREIHGAWYQGG